MSVESEPYYWIVCDCCGAKCDMGDYSAMSDESEARTAANANGSLEEVDGQDLCEACWCWPEDLPDYPGDEAWTGTDDPVRKHAHHPTEGQENR